jgi:acyl-CoA thioesterase I
MFLKTLAIIVAAYLIYEIGFYAYKFYHLPKLPSIDQSDRTLGKGPLLRYIAAGDSTGVGIGASSYLTTYPYQIAEYLAKTHTVEFKNISVTGYKTADVIQSQISQIIAYKPDIITISIGANDATHLVSSGRLLNNYRQIIGELTAGTNAQIYITDIPNFNGATILPWVYRQFIDFRSRDLNQQILTLQDARVKIIDIYNFGWSEPLFTDRSKTYAADHFHPNDLGYENWAEAFLSQIKLNY